MARKRKMKVYHGIPKSITDSYTVYYEPVDSKIPNGFNKISNKTLGYKQGVTGNYLTYVNCTTSPQPPVKSIAPITVDLWVHDIVKTDAVVIGLEDVNGNKFGFQKASTTGNVYFTAHKNSTWKAEAIVGSSVIPTGTFHMRYVADIENQIGRVYINGKLLGSTSLSNVISKFNNFTGEFIKLYCYCDKGSDIHISNIDRGDYFPNLPQDFIDGKAVIKPRMSQQQIKGDPMYSQVTILKVTNQPYNVLGTIYNLEPDSEGLNYCFEHPELATASAYEWISGEGKIRIQGLNGEIIGGVLDPNTASSSCPVVKTQDGTRVVGTWSGLGTSKATFTVGSNSDIVGKDLYVEYSLTMPYGNSDFPELPHTVERAWGENGVEMKPVNEIVIIDDFRGKISGSTKECANIIKSSSSPQLNQPSSFTFEHSTSGYKSASVIYDADNLVKSVDVDTHIPQQLFSFNLIEMVERKLGCEIPSIDKVQWLKDNLDNNASVYHYGYGVCPRGNKLVVNWWNPTSSTWTNSSQINNSNRISMLKDTTGGLAQRIDSKGFVYLLAYTDPSDGVITSAVFTDYIYLEVKLKTDPTFTTLYCENTRAREDKCNPVLIQKETKTVKRYLPSKECFTTECNYVDMPRSVLQVKDLYNYHHKGTKVYSTTRGSGMYSKYTGIYPNIINLLRLADYNAHTYLNDGLKDSPVTSTLRMSLTEQLGESYAGNTLSGMPTEYYDLPKYVQIVPYIRLNKSELELMLYTSEIVNNTDSVINYPKKMTKEYALSYKLPYRPLIR